MAVRVLSFHQTYGCRDAGVCCTSAWPIPVERDRLTLIENALAAGTLHPASGSRDAAVSSPKNAPADTPAVLGVFGTHCTFFDSAHKHHCRVQHALGHAALPLACRQFPRVTVQTPLGTSVTLSHYCPTAAGLLQAANPATIVSDAPGFPEGGEYVGLDVREALPPLLRPDILMDWHAWQAVETRAVHLLCEMARTADDGIARLHAAVEHLRRWRPAAGSLETAIDDAFNRASAGVSAYRPDRDTRVGEVLDAIPPSLRQRSGGADLKSPRATPSVETRFLAAHAFASWAAYLGTGLRSWFRGVEAAHALITSGYDIGQADLLLRHLADTSALTRAWNAAER